LLSISNKLKSSFYPFPLIKRNREAPTCTTNTEWNSWSCWLFNA